MTQLETSAGRGRRAGRMTAVMRAVRADADVDRRLRVAVVERGRVVEEQLVSSGEAVRIGEGEGLTLYVSGVAPRELFVPDGSGWRLRCEATRGGALAGAQGAEPLPSIGELVLGDHARGKVAVGSVTVLFQMVVAPPALPRPQLPASLTRGNVVDWRTTCIAAFSFLLHFFMVALAYSDWMDPIVDEDLAVARLIETTRVFPEPTPLETPTAPEEASSSEAATTQSAAPRGRATVRRPTGARRASGNRGTSAGPAESDARAAEIAAELAALDVQLISAMNEAGPATANVFEEGGVPADKLDAAARSRMGARLGEPNGLQGLDGRASRDVPPGGEGPRLADLEGGTEQRADHQRAGEEQEVEGPTGTAAITGTGNSGGNISNAAGVVARMRGRFRACYQAGLNANPELQGSVGLLAKVGPSGEVTSVSGGGGGLGAIVPCLKAVVRSGGFAPPDGGMGLVSISIVFRRQ